MFKRLSAASVISLWIFIGVADASADDIDNLRRQLKDLRERYNKAHPEIIRLRSMIRRERVKEAEEINSEKMDRASSEVKPAIAETKLNVGGKYLNADGKAILRWLESLPARKSKKILSGQYRWVENVEIFAITGTWPAIYEDHFWQIWPEWKNALKNRERMKKHWDGGGLVSVHMPIPNPKNRSTQRDRDISPSEMQSLIVDGSALNRNFKEWLDKLAAHLAWLQAEGVTVFIRPFHEMNGGWFWYGLRNPDIVKGLFRFVVTYLRKEKGLRNLIIVFSGVKNNSALAYYPGKEFVDVVGVDSYGDPPVGEEAVKAYKKMLSLGQPFALTELGWTPKKYQLAKKSKDSARDIIGAIRRKTPDAVWWLSWEWTNSPYRQKNLKMLYADPWVITKDEIAWREYSRKSKK